LLIGQRIASILTDNALFVYEIMNYNSSATANRKSTTMPAFRRQSSRLSTKSPDRLEFRRQSSRLSTKSPDRPEFRRQSSRLSTKSPERLEFRRQSSRLSTKSPERLEFRRQSSRLSTKSPDRPNSSLRISLTPKKSSGQRDSIQAFTSGIKSSNPKQLNFQKDKDISQSQSKKKQVVVISSMPPPDLLYSRSTSPRRTLYNFSPLLEEDIKKTNVDIVETKSRKSVIPQISVENRKKSIVASAASLEQLRKATVKNMIEVDESTLDMNDEGVSFSLSSRIRRKTIVLDEKNSISNEAPARLGRKFKDMSSHLSGSIVIVQDPADEPDLLKAPDTKSHTSNEGLSRTNDGTQTISAYSANVEDSPVKKLFAATVKKPSSRPEPKTLLKAPPGKISTL
jgi:hypothetical protein